MRIRILLEHTVHTRLYEYTSIWNYTLYVTKATDLLALKNLACNWCAVDVIYTPIFSFIEKELIVNVVSSEYKSVSNERSGNLTFYMGFREFFNYIIFEKITVLKNSLKVMSISQKIYWYPIIISFQIHKRKYLCIDYIHCTTITFFIRAIFGQFSHNIEAEMATIRAEGWNNDDLRLFAHNFLKKLTIMWCFLLQFPKGSFLSNEYSIVL